MPNIFLFAFFLYFHHPSPYLNLCHSLQQSDGAHSQESVNCFASFSISFFLCYLHCWLIFALPCNDTTSTVKPFTSWLKFLCLPRFSYIHWHIELSQIIKNYDTIKLCIIQFMACWECNSCNCGISHRSYTIICFDLTAKELPKIYLSSSFRYSLLT